LSVQTRAIINFNERCNL